MTYLIVFVGISIVVTTFYNAYKLRGGRLSNQSVFIGIGILFITLSALASSLVSFYVDPYYTEIVQGAFLLLGLLMVFLGVKITWDAFKP